MAVVTFLLLAGGWHFLSDIVAGGLWGALAAYVTALLWRRHAGALHSQSRFPWTCVARRTLSCLPTCNPSVWIGRGRNRAGSQDQRYLLRELRALLLLKAFDLCFNRRHDRRPVVSMARDRFSHPAVEQTDKRGRHHFAMFKIEDPFKIKAPS
jgi:hypothetical protein